MDKKKLRQYRSLKREQKMLEEKMEKLNERAERIPAVIGKVKGSMDTFPYIETHMSVVMSEPKQADVIYRQMMINGKRQEQVDELLAEIEEFISQIPDSNATKGKTLWDVMIDMYEKYGYCVDSITAMDFPGLEGMDKMKAMLANLRENPLKDIAGYKVLKIRDYSKDTVLDVESGNVEPTGLPASDVLYYELEGGAWVCVRPSGTEPKIKFYYGVKADSMDAAQTESAKFAEWAKAQA